MAEMVICKACGYVMEKGRVRDTCPACGVPAKMFQPHDERISPKRKLILSLDIHPVMVHFPQAFTGTILLLSLAGMIVRAPFIAFIDATVRTLGILLPLTIVLAFGAGIFDGKTRFRKVKTPILIRKMIFGAVFFMFGCGISAATIAMPVASLSFNIVVAVLSVGALGCATYLGFAGTSLLNARFPG